MENNTYISDFIQSWSFNSVQQLDISSVLVNFFLCVVMSFLLRRFYISRSFSLTGKTHIGSIIPILSSVVFLVILVVKSSLALSLGLVGALSIVRVVSPATHMMTDLKPKKGLNLLFLQALQSFFEKFYLLSL